MVSGNYRTGIDRCSLVVRIWYSWSMSHKSSNRREFKRLNRLLRRLSVRVMPAVVSQSMSSTTPANGFQLTNIYVDGSTNPPKLAFEYDDAMLGVNSSGGINSTPPVGNNFALTNLWYDNATGRLGFSYDDGT